MSNIALTFNFADNEEASKFFLAIGAALAGIKTAVSTAAAAAVQTVAAPIAAQFAPVEPAPAAVPAVPVAAPVARRKRGGDVAVAAAAAATAPDTVEPAAAVSVPSVPVAPAVQPAPVAPAVRDVTPNSGTVRPATISIEALRGRMEQLLKLHNNSPVAAISILSKFCPAGDKKLSAIPADKYGETWDAIEAAITAAQLAG